MKKIIFGLVIFIMSASLAAFGQANYEDVVYLKNGSIIRGVIVEQIPGQTLKIETSDRSVFVFTVDEIEKITKEKKSGRERAPEPVPQPEATGGSYTGYSLILEPHIGPGIGSNNNGGLTIGTHVVNGIMFDSRASVGIGVGFDLTTMGYQQEDLQNYSYTRSFFSALYYIDCHFFPVQGKVSPLLTVNYGYAAPMFSRYVTGGTNLNAGIGMRMNFNQRRGFNITLNYKQQNLRYEREIYDYQSQSYEDVSENFKLEYFVITLGISL